MQVADKSHFIEQVESRRDELIELCSKLIQIPSDNPPGDTKELAKFVVEYLGARGIETKTYEPKEGIVNIVASIGEGEPHLILNAHLDQFPGEVGEPWTVPPYSGLVKDGRIYGRGSGDMKGGFAGLLFSFCLLNETDFPGKITFTGTSDEETGGKWGALWLLENVEGVKGDAVLNGEPSGLTVRIGEKGKLTLLLEAYGKAAHGSFAGYVGENAVMKMAGVLPAVESLQGMPAVLDEETGSLTVEVMKGYVQQYGHESREMAEVLREVTVNIGTIQGGTKDNIVPAYCKAEVDVRVPIGITPVDFKKALEAKIRETGTDIKVSWARDPVTITGATYTSPEVKIAVLLARNSEQVSGDEPLLSFTSGGTDCRFWRDLGIPAVSYGPKVYGMGGIDENITTEDLITTTKVHITTIIDYLGKKNG